MNRFIATLSANALVLLLAGFSATADEKPMLWETSVEIVSDKSSEAEQAGRLLNTGTNILCLPPFRPKVGIVQEKGSNCRYTRVFKQGSRIFRKRVCAAYPSGRFETIIRGAETDDTYNLRLVTALFDDDGRKLSITETQETGRRVGECPQGTPMAR